MNKAITKSIRKVAYNLPIIFRQTKEKHWYTGQELLEMEYVLTPEERSSLVLTEKYEVEMPVQIAINHYRKLKEEYQSGCRVGGHEVGMLQIQRYSEAVIAIHAEHTQNLLSNVK